MNKLHALLALIPLSRYIIFPWLWYSVSGELLSILLRSVDPGVIKVVPFLNLHCGLNLISDAILRQATNLLGAFLELYDTRHGPRFETSVFVVDATTV